jgi:hypothetical protein
VVDRLYRAGAETVMIGRVVGRRARVS